MVLGRGVLLCPGERQSGRLPQWLLSRDYGAPGMRRAVRVRGTPSSKTWYQKEGKASPLHVFEGSHVEREFWIDGNIF